MIWNFRNRSLDVSHKACIMGILNVTPDSFSDGGDFLDEERARIRAHQMIEEGVDIIDVGGESTRPGSLPVSAEEEMRRTIPLLRTLRQEWNGLLSIDTTKASVARAALDVGVDIVNDVSGLTADPEMSSVCASAECGIVIMHMQGRPAHMQENPTYQNVVSEVRDFFSERLKTLHQMGISPSRLCFDPGIGFGKSLEHNLALLREIDQLAPAGFPLLLGVSRKSLIGQLIGSSLLEDRDAATHAFTVMARMKGVMLHRVHDVKGISAALRVAEALI